MIIKECFYNNNRHLCHRLKNIDMHSYVPL